MLRHLYLNILLLTTGLAFSDGLVGTGLLDLRGAVGSGAATWPSEVPKTGQTTSYSDYDDGWNSTNFGVAWPDPRFTIQANTNAVLDNLTGLMWAMNANLDGTNTWEDAKTFCVELDYAGYTDWRLPNIKELQSLIDFGNKAPALPTGHPFLNVESSNLQYWSSTTLNVNCSNLQYWSSTTRNAGSTSAYVWPVRGPD